MKILAFGEILFDIDTAKNESILGGAPMNFCSHLTKLGAEGYMLSAVGNDELGREALRYADAFGIKKDYVLLSEKPTGKCLITYNNGEPSYDLGMISAYDYIEITDKIVNDIKSENFDVFYIGTLAQRNDVSSSSLDKILAEAEFSTVFYDMNLRQHYHTREIIEKSLGACNILKINREEYDFLLQQGYAQNKEELAEKYNIDIVLLTLDKAGAEVYGKKIKEKVSVGGIETNVVSTVGAGDSMCACFLYNMLRGADAKTALERANILASYVVSHKEAIPEYTKELLDKIT
ncbi:MAG: carbohydrate kinase [Clostridia bacterium]|nr:carbohydrate kinase [Clostridia bacterium]